MNAIAIANEYVMTLYFFSLFSILHHFFHSHICSLVRALRHLYIQLTYIDIRDECDWAKRPTRFHLGGSAAARCSLFLLWHTCAKAFAFLF